MLFNNFCHLLKIILISATEGLTEFLPVSSTAHILVLGYLTDIKIGMEFLVGIQLGAVLAVCFLYFTRIKEICAEILTFKLNLATKFILITLPACLFGAVISSIGYFEFFPKYTINITLIFGGIVMLYFQKYSGSINDIRKLSNKHAIIIGLFQAISLIPGVSRSASVIVGALVCGASRRAAIEISFLSGVPIILAATVLEVYKGFKTGVHIQSYGELSIGFICAFIFACIGIRLLKSLSNANIDFKFFGIYRIIMGSLLFFVM